MPPRDAPPRLGRGLAALFGELPQAIDAEPGVLKLADLQPGPFQPRTSIASDDLDELVASVRAHGILQPVLVRPDPTGYGRHQIIAGERRWRAAALAGLTEIPVLVRPLSDSDAMAAGLVENLQRRDLDAIEEARGLKRLLGEFGLTQDQLGQALGKSRSHIANSLRLLTLPGTVQDHVTAGRLSAGHARAALAHADPVQAAEAMVAGQLSVREAEQLALVRPARVRRAPPERNADIAELSARLSERLGLLVSVRHGATGGQVVIHYRSLDQLDSLLTLIG